MDGKQFKEQLKSAAHGPWCICATDLGLRDIYLQKLKNAVNADKVIYVYSLSTFRPMGKLLNQRMLYVYISDNCDETLFDHTVDIVQLTTKLDARTSFVKKHRDRIVELKNLTPSEIRGWISKNSDLNDEQIVQLMELCNQNFAKIRNELMKYGLSNLTWDNFKVQTYDHVKDAVFKLCESLIINDRQKSVYYLDHCKRIGESPMVVLTVLSNDCKQLLQVQNCPNPTVQNTGIANPYTIMQTKKLSNLRTNEQLSRIIKLCNELDMQIKSGQIDSTYVMDYVVAKVLTI